MLLQVFTAVPPRVAVSVLHAALLPNMHAAQLVDPPTPLRGTAPAPLPPPAWLPHTLLSLLVPLQALVAHACASAPPVRLAAFLDLSVFPAVPPAPAIAPLLCGRTALVLRPSRPPTALPPPPPTAACAANRAAVIAAVCACRNLLTLEFLHADRDACKEIARALSAATHLRSLALSHINLDHQSLVWHDAVRTQAGHITPTPNTGPLDPRLFASKRIAAAPTAATPSNLPPDANCDALYSQLLATLRTLGDTSPLGSGTRHWSGLEEWRGSAPQVSTPTTFHLDTEHAGVDVGDVGLPGGAPVDTRAAYSGHRDMTPKTGERGPGPLPTRTLLDVIARRGTEGGGAPAAPSPGEAVVRSFLGITALRELRLRECRLGRGPMLALALGVPGLQGLAVLSLLRVDMPGGGAEAVLRAAGALQRLTAVEFEATAAQAEGFAGAVGAGEFWRAVGCLPSVKVRMTSDAPFGSLGSGSASWNSGPAMHCALQHCIVAAVSRCGSGCCGSLCTWSLVAASAQEYVLLYLGWDRLGLQAPCMAGARQTCPPALRAWTSFRARLVVHRGP